MDKESAKKLIRNTFQNSFNKKSFIYFIKNLLNQYDESKVFHLHGCYIPDSFKDYIKSYERIGTYTDPEGKKIDILIVNLKRGTTIDRARTAQRNFIARYLKERDEKDAGLIAFVSPQEEDWRFSFVKMEYKFKKTPKGDVKVKEEFTPARRYSFLIGKNESSHTAQSCFVDILINDTHNLKLNEIEEAFNIEKVTKEFYEKYRNLFFQVKDALVEIVKEDEEIRKEFQEKGVNVVDFSKKLLGQIVFLYFLQKKGWFGVKKGQKWGSGSKHFLRELFEKKHCDYKNFFNDVLEPLFYEALRNDRSYDDHYFSYFKCKIPFLNGGLFDPLSDYNWAKTDILLADTLFSNQVKTKEGDIGTGVLDVFDRYNFTVKEDEPLEKEVAVDPEMLGKVFENLLEVKDRKSKGTYYTPREIVHYMCQQSLINYLYTEVNSKQKRRTKEENIQMKLLGKPDPIQQSLIIEKDSNIISKEDIEKLIKYGDTTIENDNHVATKGEETKTYSFKLPENIRKNAEIVDEVLKNIRVCDPAIGSGAFPVGMMNEIIRARNALTPYLLLRETEATKQSRTMYNFKRHAIQNCLYGVDIDPGAVEIAKLRLWLSLIVDEEDIKHIKPLPNLDYKIVCGNSLLGVERNLENWKLFAKLEELKPLFFNETNASKKQEYKMQIDELISEITNGHKDFDFEVYFSEVFHEKNGFDVVIANPPYGANIDSMVNVYKRKYSESIKNYADIFKIFFNLGLNICKKNGVETFITPNTYLSQPRYKDLRKYLLKYKLLSILNLGQRVFKGVNVPVVVTIIMKAESKSKYSFCDLSINSTFSGDLSMISYKIIDQNTVVNSSDFNLLSVYEYKENEFPLDNVLWIKDAGIQYHRSGIGLKNKGGSNLYFRIFNERENCFKNYKPTWYGKLIDSYYIQRETKEFFNLDYKKVLKNNESVSFSKDAFTQPAKILWRQTASYIRATLDTNKRWFRNTIQCGWTKDQYSNILDIRYILALLNSNYSRWLYNKIVNEVGRVFPQVKVTHVKKLPIRIIAKEEQKPFISLVNKILSITKSNDYLQNETKQKKVRGYKQEINKLVYKLYELTEEEIKMVEDFNSKI